MGLAIAGEGVATSLSAKVRDVADAMLLEYFLNTLGGIFLLIQKGSHPRSKSISTGR